LLTRRRAATQGRPYGASRAIDSAQCGDTLLSEHTDLSFISGPTVFRVFFAVAMIVDLAGVYAAIFDRDL
jgi:hypothetical protein